VGDFPRGSGAVRTVAFEAISLGSSKYNCCEIGDLSMSPWYVIHLSKQWNLWADVIQESRLSYILCQHMSGVGCWVGLGFLFSGGWVYVGGQMGLGGAACGLCDGLYDGWYYGLTESL